MSGTRVGSLRNPLDCRQAARMMRDGEPVGVFGRSVASIWIDPSSEAGVAAVYGIKGAKRAGMPLGMALSRDDLPRLIDPDQVAPEVRRMFLNGDDLAGRLSTLVWIRFPVRPAAAGELPGCLLSMTADGTKWAQGWISGLGDAHGVLVARLLENGVRLIAPTSMNVSGEPEIVAVEDGAAFCAQHGISLYLWDPDDGEAVRGSYPIVEVNRRGVRLVREGHFPSYLLSCLLDGVQLDLDGHRAAKYPLVPTHTLEQAQALSCCQLHDEIQAALNRQGHAVLR
jgi:hypothetical protein